MKKFLLPTLFALVLTACGNSGAISMDATFLSEGSNDKAELILATKNIITRRLARLESELLDFDVTYNTDGTVSLGVEGTNKEAMEQLLLEMTTPFIIEIRLETDEPTEDDITVEGLGSFRATGVTNKHMTWVLSRSANNALGQGEVMIQFTEEGATKMGEVFKGNVGKNIGLFIRGQLTANFAIQEETFGSAIIIPNVPTPELANIFADDMNVGINMTFTSAQ